MTDPAKPFLCKLSVYLGHLFMADSLVISGLAGLFDELGQSLVELNPADTVFPVKL